MFRFAGRKGQGAAFRVESRTLGAPLDPVLVVSDAAGKRLAEADDAGKDRDPKLAFTPPGDGDYLLTVRDLHGRGGDRFVYRLTATIPGPDYQLSLAADRFTLTPGKPLSVPVTVERTGGFDGVVEVRAADLPDGVTAEPVRTAGTPAARATVELKLSSETGPSSGPIRVVGRVVEGTGPERTARAAIAGLGAAISHAWLTVLAPRPEEPRKDEKAGPPATPEEP